MIIQKPNETLDMVDLQWKIWVCMYVLLSIEKKNCTRSSCVCPDLPSLYLSWAIMCTFRPTIP